MFIFSYYHLVIFDGFEKDSDLFMLFFMRLHKIEVSNFNIASMGEEFGPRNIFSSLLSGPPHPPNMETVKNQLFQEHHNHPK